MAELTLQEYCQEIEGLIERSAYDEAAAHCRHILEQYPKYIEAYRLMGKAALDREDDERASEMFARVLSADPADFVSRAGLSIIYDRQEKLKEAVWQMERAYELEPGNPVVQDELRKLYARRDGVTPERIPLTRGTLARLYLNGELNSEAVAELRALLSQEPDRVDLQVLLAEALWRDEQRLESADMALKVLDRLPYCLDANLVLGEIWMNGGREEDAEVHLKRATSLDPEATRAWALFGKSSPIPVKSIELTRLGYVSPTAVAPVAEQAPEWLSGLGLQPEAGEAEQVPSWLQGVGAPAPEVEQPAAKEPGLKLPTREPQLVAAPEEEMPAWLSGLGVAAEPSVEERPVPSTEGETVPDWLSQLRGVAAAEAEQPAAAAEEEGVPDWLSQLHVEAGPVAGEVTELAAEAPEPAEIPDWLQALRPPGAEQPAEAVEGEPEWLSAVSAPVPPAAVDIGAPEVAEVPDWMQALRPEGVEQPTEAVEGVPEWLAGVSASVPPAAVEEEVVEAPQVAEVPDWMQALRPEGVEQPTEAVEGVPEWLADMSAPVPPAVVEEEFAGTPAPAGIPDWLQALRPQEVEPIAPVEAEPVVPISEVTAEPVTLEVEPTPAWLAGEGAMPSPEEAMAYFAKLTAGKEVELQAQAEAEAESRMVEIMGRKPAPTVAPAPGPVTPPPAPVVIPQPPTVQAPPPPVEQAPAWLAGEGAMPSPEEAMAYFAKLTAGKEVVLQAQAEAEAESRMVEIMGRKPAPAPAPVVIPQPPAAKVKPTPVIPPVEEAKPVVAPVPPAPVLEEAGPAPAEWIEAVAAEAMLPKAESPELPVVSVPFAEKVPMETTPAEAMLSVVELGVLEEPVSAVPPKIVSPGTPVEVVPEVVTHVPAAPQAAGPDWWYQTLADEEGPTEAELAAEALAEAAQVEEAAVIFEPPAPEPVPPAPIPAARVGRKPTAPLPAPPPEPTSAARVERKPTGPLPPLPPEPAPAPVPATRETKRLVRAKPAPAVPPKPVVNIEALMARLRANPDDRGALLDLARGWVELDDLTAARGAYDELIRAGASLDQVIFDLEAVQETHPDDVDTIRLMGDAHMKSGNLQKALKLYRQALKKL